MNSTPRSIQGLQKTLRTIQTDLAHAAQTNEDHKNILTEEQKAMLPAKHVSFLPCKTVAKWEGDASGTVHEMPLSGRGPRAEENRFGDVKVPDPGSIKAGAINGAANEVKTVLRERERESSSDARRRAGSADEMAGNGDESRTSADSRLPESRGTRARESSVDSRIPPGQSSGGRPHPRPATQEYSLSPRPHRPGGEG